MKTRTAKFGSIVMACGAFVGVLSYAQESQAYWYTVQEAYSEATQTTSPGTIGARCYQSDGDICTVGDSVSYTMSALNFHSPTITVTPRNPESWVVSGSDYAWCSVSITCHIGGGGTETFTDEHVWQPGLGSPVGCSVTCIGTSDSADDMYVNVGVGIYPP